MTGRIYAGIELDRNILRYAETELSGSTPRLLRLGSCVFDFDIERELLDDPPDDILAHVTDALRDVFTSTRAKELRLVLHSHRALSFLSAVDTSRSPEERAKQFLAEARQLAGIGSVPFHIVPTPLHSEKVGKSSVDWFHISVVPRRVFSKLGNIVQALNIPTHKLWASAIAVTRVMNHIPPTDSEKSSRFRMAVGRYDGFSEYVLVQNRRLRFASTVPSVGPVSLEKGLQTVIDKIRCDLEDIGMVWEYGLFSSKSHDQKRKKDSQIERSKLDPASFLQLEPDGIMASATLQPFIPCIGGSL